MISSLIGISMFLSTLWFVMFHSSGEKFTGFYNQTALILLAAGPLAIILISRSLGDVWGAIRTLLTMTFSSDSKEKTNVANSLAIISRDVTARGMGALAGHRNSVKNPLFRDGLALILNGFTADEIKHNLIAKTNIEHARMIAASSMFEQLGKIAPAMGLLGTLVGLVQMLANLSDPSAIGPGMAVSLLATLYGLILANAIYIPLADRVETYSERYLQVNTMVLEGILLLKERKSSAHLRDVVKTYKGQHAENAGAHPQAETEHAKNAG
jgi:chemotaxis protein MotA